MPEQPTPRRRQNRSRPTVSAKATARQTGPFNPSVLGRAAHELIAELCVTGLRTACWEDISHAVALHPACRQPAARRQAARLWLCSVVSMYFRLFVPPQGWSLVGSEVAAAGCRFDLVWRSRFDQTCFADELKTGKAADFIGGRQLEQQLARQLRGGHHQYGEAFTGVRVLILAAPRRSFVAATNGHRALLYPEDNA